MEDAAHIKYWVLFSTKSFSPAFLKTGKLYENLTQILAVKKYFVEPKTMPNVVKDLNIFFPVAGQLPSFPTRSATQSAIWGHNFQNPLYILS